jgi:PhnB protein
MQTQPFLTFAGNCNEAVNFYVSILGGSIDFITYAGPGVGDARGPVKLGMVKIAGVAMLCRDAAGKRDEGMNPPCGLFIAFDSYEEIDNAFYAFKGEAIIFEPLDKYPFAERYCSFIDRFGISWQFAVNYNWTQPQ